MSVFSFRKDEILRKKKIIEQLFAEGSTLFNYPFKIFWLITPLESKSPAQVLINVSKRNFKRAVDRNRIKRQIKEAYRLNKHPFYLHLENDRQQCAIAIIYTANAHMLTPDIESKIKASLNRLISEMEKKLNNTTPFLSDNINL